MILYHYTTTEGLHGIVKSKSIWASDYRFLNDSTEFEHGRAIFDRIFDSYRAKLPPNITDVINHFRHAIEIDTTFCVFIASFCQDGDLLSQWRGYRAGYTLGINAQWLEENAKVQEFDLTRIEYDPGAQQKVVYDKLHLLSNQIAGGIKPEDLQSTLRTWWERMLVAMTALKNESFREEREYRLVRAKHGWPSGIHCRSAPNGLVPFMPVELNKKKLDYPPFEPKNFGMESVVLGPGLPDWQHAAVDALLASQHMRFAIEKSKIPFR